MNAVENKVPRENTFSHGYLLCVRELDGAYYLGLGIQKIIRASMNLYNYRSIAIWKSSTVVQIKDGCSDIKDGLINVLVSPFTGASILWLYSKAFGG